MDEFYDLFLRGERAHSRIKFRRFIRIFTAVGAVIMLVPLLITVSGGEYAALNSAFSVVGLVFELASILLAYVQALCERGLTEVQNAANEAELRGEERALFRRLYLAWERAIAKRDIRRNIAPVCKTLAYTVLTVSVVVASYLAVPSFVLVIVIFATAALLIASSVMQTLSDLRMRAALYEEGEEAIDEIKRKQLGYDEAKIAKEAENARAASAIPAPVELFLKEDTEKEDFRAVSKKSTMLGVFLGVLYFAVLVVGISCGNALETLGAAVSWTLVLAVFAVIFAVSVVAIFPISRRQKEIFARNFRKLGDSETDVLRKNLQTLWIRSQRAGNIMFGCFTAGAVALGIALGLISYFTNADGMPLAQSIAVSVLPILVYAALLSLVVWTVMYAVARRKMRPVEAQLRECMRTE